MPPPAVTKSPAELDALYRSTVQEASASGTMMMGKLVAAARQVLQTRENASRDLRERDALAESGNQLRQCEPDLCKRFPQVLLQAFSKPLVAKGAVVASGAEILFDQLELMDETQVLTSVALARIQQTAMLAAEASLAELDTLICSTLGLGAVQSQRNPLRPEVFVSALKDAIGQSQAPSAMQLDWLGAMSSALSTELKSLYTRLSDSLKQQGVVAAGYAVVQAAAAPGIGRGLAQGLSTDTPAARTAPAQAPIAVRMKDESLLTLDKLRRLLSGELDAAQPLSKVDHFAQQFAREFEGGPAPVQAPVTDFDATVPAALQALTEMKQVDRVVQSLEQRNRGPAGQPLTKVNAANAMQQQRDTIRRNAKNVAQALSLEVVALMVDNMAQDPRLLEPVHHIIRNLEPALLRLALSDPRFFTEKSHPARQLLQELTHRSLAFESVSSSGFEGFLRELEAAVAPLATMEIADDEPFERVLMGLQEAWGRAARLKERAREQAVFALQHAEARNLLAEKIARSVDTHPDAAQVPEVVIDFLCGPWAQVVAHARIKGGAGCAVADKYQALISALLWSAHPELSRQNVAKLTRLVPRLLGTLREGLDSIQYPSTKTSAFFESLMAIHQQAFKGPDAEPVAPLDKAAQAAAASNMRSHFVERGDLWIAPEEALSSNFVEIEATPTDPAEAQVTAAGPMAPVAPVVAVMDAATLDVALSELPLGSWIEMMSSGQWVRTQLTWASPHGTLFLFTTSIGATQSMTRRSRDRLIAAGQLRMISGQPIVEGALDAVAQLALRNSVGTSN